MFTSKMVALLGTLAFSASAAAFTACGFNIPDDGGLGLKVDDGCTYVVQGKRNYAKLDYLGFSGDMSIQAMLSDNAYFVEENGEHYFISEDVEDPKVTIKTIKMDPAKPVSFNDMTGYTASGEFFVQVLQDWKNREKSNYSLKLSCTFLAAGDEKKSFRSRFCVPETTEGRKLAARYNKLMMRVMPR
ncbi:hypothetical protein [Burkholderia stagnalis]|uniref:hypothetical protein n=1 Tax=Burkholderia stagnalis TaxID=1503054 RepID=UPI000F5684C9|nr:hypothetical protein [Burkholderia stagnalis]